VAGCFVQPAGVASEIPFCVEVKVPVSGGAPPADVGVALGSGVGSGVGDADGAGLDAGGPATDVDDEPGLRNQTPRAPTATTTTAAAASLA
jgi:hypothetical protein